MAIGLASWMRWGMPNVTLHLSGSRGRLGEVDITPPNKALEVTHPRKAALQNHSLFLLCTPGRLLVTQLALRGV